jgi:tetratricopeptide (TPR) repeat protein
MDLPIGSAGVMRRNRAGTTRAVFAFLIAATAASAENAAAQNAAAQNAAEQTLAAEVAIAKQEIATGKPLAAIERLERVLDLRPSTADAGALGTLAVAYNRAGFRSRFIATAERALAAGLSGADATDLRARLDIARKITADDAGDAGTAQILPDTDFVNNVLADGWRAYGAKDFARAAQAFKLAADSTPSTAERWETRLMQAQAAVESGAAQPAGAIYQGILDSVRTLNGAIDARITQGSPVALGRLLAQRRGLGLLWAGEAGGRLVLSDARTATLQAMSRGAVRDAMAPMVPPGEIVAPALAWTKGGAAAASLRLIVDSLGEADARVARATTRVAGLRSGRAGRIADATRYVAVVRGFADTLNASEAQLRAYGAQVAQRDSAINATIAEYKASIVAKINDARTLATENRARIDSLETAARRQGELTVRFLEAEQGTAREYLAVAEAAAGALERGLTRLDVSFERDTVHQKFDRLNATLRQARANYDSSLAAAQAAERTVTADVDREIAAAEKEMADGRAQMAVVVARAEVVAGEVLVSRAPALKERLARLTTLAQHGLGNALFHAAIEVDTARASATEVQNRRVSALAALAEALGPPIRDRTSELPETAVRSQLVLEHAELLTRKADADFATSQRGANPMERPDYVAAIARYDELLRLYPNDPRADVAAYTMGTIAFSAQRYEDAERGFGIVMGKENSPFRPEAFFRNGDAQFERAAKVAGEARRAGYSGAAAAYDRAISLAPPQGDIYFLALYKLGWSNYMQAERQSSDEYRRAVEVFSRLVREVDALPPERQARLALRQEAIDYLAIAITQLGGAEDAVRFLGNIPDVGTRMLVLRRVAHALRDQGEFNNSIVAFKGALATAPTHTNVLETRLELVDLFQSRMLEPVRAQEARLDVIDSLTATSPWALANPARVPELTIARERVMREAGSYALTRARGLRGVGPGTSRVGTVGQGRAGTTQREQGLIVASTPDGASAYAAAADLFARYIAEFAASDSAQRVSALEGDARFGARDWFASGNAYSRTATKWTRDSSVAAAARRNALIAFDSALVNERKNTVRDTAVLRAIEDSLFAATERFVANSGQSSDDSRQALVVMGRRASEAARWETVATTFTRVADGWPTNAIAPEARKFVGDARFKQGRYAEAQAEWKRAFDAATAAKRKPLADSIVNVRTAAASQRADSLSKAGSFTAAADSVLTAMAADIGDPARAADLLRNAIEVHLDADSTYRARTDSSRAWSSMAASSKASAIGLIERLTATYPNYQHTLTYSGLRARLLVDVGRPADGAAALMALADANPRWPGRADAMVRAAVLLDSIGKPAEAAAAYEKFSVAYPADKRAVDAQYNAAVILRDAKEYAGAARAFMAFVNRYPGEKRIGDAFAARIAMVRATGDTSALGPELARLCVRPQQQLAALGPGVLATCADRQGAREFSAGMQMWDRYAAMKLEIKTKAQLSQAGVAAASAPKQQLLRLMNGSFTRAVATGASEWVAAGTYQTGLAQWHYGLFVRDVELPADITDAQRQGATTGSAQQAQQYFDAAIKAWTALVEKATTDKFENAWVDRARAALKGEGIPAREKTP